MVSYQKKHLSKFKPIFLPKKKNKHYRFTQKNTPSIFAFHLYPNSVSLGSAPRHLASCKTAHLAAPKPSGDELLGILPPLGMSAWKIVSMVSKGVITSIYIPTKARL